MLSLRRLRRLIRARAESADISSKPTTLITTSSTTDPTSVPVKEFHLSAYLLLNSSNKKNIY